ncbi:MAG TPA: UdgX family uracil-DNA binding protein [Acetobacteraceae bacterium]|nr:UdgX family uracil-DNA binding protein [Acetobacteraceae bacterium]
MRRVVLANETDWEGWRKATRSLVLAGVEPDEVRWAVRSHNEAGDPLQDGTGSFGVSRSLVSLASVAIQAREKTRFDLLYRVVWNANAGQTEDELLRRAQGLALAARAEAHRMRTHIRFLPVDGVNVGWYEPAHFVLEANAQLIARRFPEQRFAIVTPDGAAQWDGTELRFAAGARIEDDDALRDWRMPNDARVGTAIPEAEDLDEAPRPPDRPALGPVVLRAHADRPLIEAMHEASDCRRCHLYEAATQTVFGEGPAHAKVLFVGEQPGDQEDVIGRPFVGPAGQIMDRAMEEAGIDRRTIYITNAVKHFKFTPRGKRRIHQTPEAPEIQACRFWLDVELVRMQPKLIVAMGGTAARALLGRPVTITRERGRAIELPDGQRAFVTVHPSFLLRVPDEDAKTREYRAFVEDLRKVAELVDE